MTVSLGGLSFFDSLARARSAKARLSEMITQEVSLVDAAANLRRFVVVKRNSMDEQVNKVALRLPPEAKRGIMDGLATALDKLTALATVVGDAEEDAQAIVPPDLGQALKQCAVLIGGLADQYAAMQEPAPGGETVPPEIGAPLVEAALEPTGKALPSPQNEGLTLAPVKDPLTMTPQNKSAIAEAFKAVASEMAETMKAGRKIAGQRYKKLAELHDTLGKLLNELAYDDAADDAGMNTPAPAKKANEPITKSNESAEILAIVKAIAASTEGEAIEKNRLVEASRARLADGGAVPSAVRWPLDMSAALAKRKKAEGRAAR